MPQQIQPREERERSKSLAAQDLSQVRQQLFGSECLQLTMIGPRCWMITSILLQPASSQTHSVFRPYRSPLSSMTPSPPFPLQRSLPALGRSPSPSSSLSSSYYAQIQQLDLGPLRRARASLIDPQRQLCQYEIPGGGTCRDKTCQDVHLKDLDPDGEAFAWCPIDVNSADPSLPLSWLQMMKPPYTWHRQYLA